MYSQNMHFLLYLDRGLVPPCCSLTRLYWVLQVTADGARKTVQPVEIRAHFIYSTVECRPISCMPSVLWRCCLGGRKGIRPVKKTEWWGEGVVICLERGANLHMAQLMPLPLIVSCFSKIQIGFYRAMLCIRGTSHGPVSVCVRVYVRLSQIEVLLKRLNVGSHKQYYTIARGL